MRYSWRFAIAFLAALMSPSLFAEEREPDTLDKWLEEFRAKGGHVAHDKERAHLGIQRLSAQKTASGLKGLRPPPKVISIGLQGFDVEDEDLLAVAGWPDIECIDTVDCKKLTDRGIVPLARLKKLSRITLADTSVTEKGVNAFSGHEALIRFELLQTIIPGQVEKIRFESMPKLEILSVTCEGLKSIHLKNLPKLREFLDAPTTLEKASFEKLPLIDALDLHGTNLEKLDLVDLPKLKRLNLRDTKLPAPIVESFRAWLSKPK